MQAPLPPPNREAPGNGLSCSLRGSRALKTLAQLWSSSDACDPTRTVPPFAAGAPKVGPRPVRSRQGMRVASAASRAADPRIRACRRRASSIVVAKRARAARPASRGMVSAAVPARELAADAASLTGRGCADDRPFAPASAGICGRFRCSTGVTSTCRATRSWRKT